MGSVKLSQWAKDRGLSYRGALRMYHAGKLENAYQLPTGTILVKVTDDKTSHNECIKRAAIYARVSTRKQSKSLKLQIDRATQYALGRGYQITKTQQDIASGLNENRKGLNSLLTSNDWEVLIVEHKDRLARFGTAWIEGWVRSTGRSIEYVNITEGDTESLADDLIAIIASFSGRMYGKRGAMIRARRAVGALDE